MADVRVTGGPPAPLPAPRSNAARTAQRAFFQAALTGVAPAAPTRPEVAAPAAKPAAPAPTAAATDPPRIARPGSLLDIRV